MAAREIKQVDASKSDESSEEVLVPIAYVLSKAGEVVMLNKGPFATEKFVEGKEGEAYTLAHLRSIGFIGHN